MSSAKGAQGAGGGGEGGDGGSVRTPARTLLSCSFFIHQRVAKIQVGQNSKQMNHRNLNTLIRLNEINITLFE